MNRFLKSFLRKIVVILPLLYIAFYFKEYMSSMDGKISGDKIIINEVVSDNFSGFTDEEGKYADWIEIYNPTKTDIDLGDYSIGKKRNGDKSCRLPSVILKSGEYLVVFADGKNYVSDVIHLSFSLDKSGETLYLFMGDEIKDSFCFPELNTDESFGRRYFSTIETGVFAFATPGKSNPDFFKRRRREENIGNIYFSQGGVIIKKSFNCN